MLAGWAMLSAPCPNPSCRGTPLLQRKGKLPKLCVCCSAEYDAQGNQTNAESKTSSGNAGESSSSVAGALPSASASPLPPSQRLSASLNQGLANGRSVSLHDDDNDDAVFSRPPPAKSMSAFEVAAAGVSKHLVKGWALHADECPTCASPTMSHAAPPAKGGSNGAKVCVNANCSAAAAVGANNGGMNVDAAATTRQGPAAVSTRNVASESGYASDHDDDNDVDDDDDDVMSTGMGLMSSPDYAAAEAAYRAQRFGAKKPPPPRSPGAETATTAVPPRQSPSFEATTMAAARARASAAVAAKLHWCAEILESPSSSSASDLQRESRAADLMFKLVQTANALRDGRE